jgi:serine/threonine protein kinase
MLAALNHPNIATIYGLEHSDGLHYLVMELVGGQTLAEGLLAGVLPTKRSSGNCNPDRPGAEDRIRFL